ncbi:AraC family transcriptional regulator [Paenibacillus sp. BR1-192]|uniref:AraC family transcriptional regulator n=1 Tax=Paenibacillus sp. BR1-192 TaxID=3032287 RepID=UPI00240E130F|nr:AraC family transcriptional regulator [Paenibacillus sp. BR1-192]WFB59634.1 AraC family transcriptional regulator [Paenibacillus sp. BR1-192]
MSELQNGVIKLYHYYYWHKKQSFQYKEDIYLHWVAFAVQEGRFRYELGSLEAGEAVNGDWVVCPPGTPFRREVLQPLSFFYLGFEWSTPPSNLPLGKLTFADQERLASAYRYMQQLYALPPEQAMLWRNRFIQELWDGYVLQQLLPMADYWGAGDSLMLSARRKLQELAFQNVSMKELADESGLSPVQFTRRFKAAFGCSASEYVRQLRLDHGKRLLIESPLTVDHIAQECGYDNGFYFSRVFSLHIGMSPSEYRRAHRL